MSDPALSTRLVGGAVLRNELVREVLEARLISVLATFDLSRGIHAIPMWYAATKDVILLATGSNSRKVRNLEIDPRATLVLHDSRSGYEVCGASIAGAVEIVRGAEARPLVALVHARYIAESAHADPSVRPFLLSDDVALCLRPATAFTWDERRSAASEALRARGEALPLLSTDPR